MQPIAIALQGPVSPESLARLHTGTMLNFTKALALSVAALSVFLGFQKDPSGRGYQPEYTADAQLKFPDNYRNWIYLTSGFDMSYAKGSTEPDHHMFDNVFVDPEAYKAFLETGAWPDKTVFALEARMAQSKTSINQRGHSQGEIMAVEVHVKDSKRFSGGWGFFSFDDGAKIAKVTPQTASCYSCHSGHGAVDTTFVQFYPTLLPIATAKNTLSEAYKNEAKQPE